MRAPLKTASLAYQWTVSRADTAGIVPVMGIGEEVAKSTLGASVPLCPTDGLQHRPQGLISPIIELLPIQILISHGHVRICGGPPELGLCGQDDQRLASGHIFSEPVCHSAWPTPARQKQDEAHPRQGPPGIRPPFHCGDSGTTAAVYPIQTSAARCSVACPQDCDQIPRLHLGLNKSLEAHSGKINVFKIHREIVHNEDDDPVHIIPSQPARWNWRDLFGVARRHCRFWSRRDLVGHVFA